MKIGFIGAGHMAQAIMIGLCQQKYLAPSDILVHSAHKSSYGPFAAEHSLTAMPSNAALVKQSDIVILAVPAKQTLAVVADLQAEFDAKQPIVVSVAGGVSLAQLQENLDSTSLSIIRAMPNVNVAIGQGMTALVTGEATRAADLTQIEQLFQALGDITPLAEKDFAVFGALAGSAPAYAYLFIDALSRAGVKYGLDKAVATKIAAQTVLGSAANVAASDTNPWALIDQVSSPGGTTVAGLLAMEEAGLMTAVVKGIDATIAKENEA
ncbi:pyrroline-5-carboxylate reductase [Loigolactobacillus zhaoyuanensis]|uniref:pyrroline-5-carboxylate reductase n=1 Tax=Loigolactobacillus zhaoyuanensis TaxID=2486017 RepID=UPI000F739BFC|nr:pyrroline-5-carboxylate reductase [Loigolactobacillus zhaoyuanensis]